VKEAFREGFINRNAMADWYENDRTWTLTNGSDVTARPRHRCGGDGWTARIHCGLPHRPSRPRPGGSVFTIAGVYACHPETKQAQLPAAVHGHVGDGRPAVSRSRPDDLGLSATTAAKRNVCKSDGTALLTDGLQLADLTFVGAASTSYRHEPHVPQGRLRVRHGGSSADGRRDQVRRA
jgi:hypothetical protein